MEDKKDRIIKLINEHKFDDVEKLISELDYYSFRELIQNLDINDIHVLVLSIKNEDLQLGIIRELDEEEQEKFINENISIKNKFYIIPSLSEEKQIQYTDFISKNIDSFSDEEKLTMFYYASDEIKAIIIGTIKDNGKKEQFISGLKNEKKYEYIKSNRDELSEEFVNKVLIDSLRSDLKNKILFEDKQNISVISNRKIHELVGKDFVKEHINDFLKKELPNEDIAQMLDVIKEIENNLDDSIYIKMDFRLLEKKYIEAIGIEGLINIATNDEKQNEIFSLSNEKLKILGKCLENNPIKNEKDDYKRLLESMVSNISKGDFDDLINDIDDIEKLTEADISILTKILQKDNEFEIKSIKDLRNYEELKKQKCDEWIKSDDINVKRKAVLEKIFGLNRIYPEYYDIDDLQEGDVKKYLQSVQKIMEIDNPKILEDIYYESTEQIQIDELLMRKDIRKEYGKLYNDGLLKIEQCEKIGDNIYDAGTDFKMIVHVRSHLQDKNKKENFYNDWNREFDGGTNQFCASYIRNDMTRMVNVVDRVTYGFSKLQPETIIGTYEFDIGSLNADNGHLKSPERIINFTDPKYNELHYKRFYNGERQQPDYIVVLRINGEINEKSWSESIKAQKDWDEKLPIVIVDVNKCIEAERQRVEELKKEYEKSKSPILARQIYYKIRNNQHTIKWYGSRLQESFFEGELEQYEVTDEAIEKYTKEHNNETKQDVQSDNTSKTKMEKIFDEISEIISRPREIKPENVVLTDEEIKKSELEEQLENHENNPEQEEKIEITPTDIAILDKEKKVTTTEVKRNILKRLLDKAKEKFKQGKNKDGR